MLVLDRKVQEGFWIEGRIFVKVLSVGRRRVKLGIEAPADSKIIREELKDGIAEHADQLAERSTR
jgi:carbon storage regulator